MFGHCKAVARKFKRLLPVLDNFPFIKFIAFIWCCSQCYCCAFCRFRNICTCCTMAIGFYCYCVCLGNCVFDHDGFDGGSVFCSAASQVVQNFCTLRNSIILRNSVRDNQIISFTKFKLVRLSHWNLRITTWLTPLYFAKGNALISCSDAAYICSFTGNGCSDTVNLDCLNNRFCYSKFRRHHPHPRSLVYCGYGIDYFPFFSIHRNSNHGLWQHIFFSAFITINSQLYFVTICTFINGIVHINIYPIVTDLLNIVTHCIGQICRLTFDNSKFRILCPT